jgi:uncharacterized membrane protein SirB2
MEASLLDRVRWSASDFMEEWGGKVIEVAVTVVKVSSMLLLISEVSLILAQHTPTTDLRAHWLTSVPNLRIVYYIALATLYLDMPEKK